MLNSFFLFITLLLKNYYLLYIIKFNNKIIFLISKNTKNTTSADAANVFIRNILSNLGEKLGGINEKEWEKNTKILW